MTLTELSSYFKNVRLTADGFDAMCPVCEAGKTTGRGHLHGSLNDDGKLLLHCHHGCEFEDIVKAAGLPNSNSNEHREKPPVSDSKQSKRRAYASIETAAKSLARGISGTHGGTWYYTDDFAVVRFNTGNGSKQFRPLHRTADGWHVGDPDGKLPLCGISELPDTGTVLIVEGEKCCEAALSVGLFATTSAHGAKSASKTDWTPLAKRDVVVWPDADEPGRRYANDVAAILHKLGCNIRIIEPPDELGEGGDIVNWLDARDAQEPDALFNTVAELMAEATVWTPPAAESDTCGDGDGELLAPVVFYSAAELACAFPNQSEAVIDGIMRRGEVCTFTGGSKSQKSWFTLQMAVIAATGGEFHGFATRESKVCLLDFELQGGTLNYRLQRVSEALGIRDLHNITAVPLRGRPDINADTLPQILDGKAFDLLIVDPLYSMYPAKFDENSNSDMALLYRKLQAIAENHQAALCIVHHHSKGSQGGKDTIDLGAGAGALHRSSDILIGMRPHAHIDNAAVFGGRLRSFEPLKDFAMLWHFPLWTRDDSIDASRIKGRRAKAEPKPEKTRWTAQDLVEGFLTATPQPADAIAARVEAGTDGEVKPYRVKELLRQAVAVGIAFEHGAGTKGTPKTYSTMEAIP